MLFAEALEPSISVWQLILQAGAFGLLCWVVIVLAPNMLRDARQERESRDTRFEQLVNTLQARNDARNDAIVASIQSQTDRLVQQIEKQTNDLSRSVATSCQAAAVCRNWQPRPGGS